MKLIINCLYGLGNFKLSDEVVREKFGLKILTLLKFVCVNIYSNTKCYVNIYSKEDLLTS